MEVLTANDIETLKNLQVRMYELLSDAWVEFGAEVSSFASCLLPCVTTIENSMEFNPRV